MTVSMCPPLFLRACECSGALKEVLGCRVRGVSDTNKDVIAVNQDLAGVQAKLVMQYSQVSPNPYDPSLQQIWLKGPLSVRAAVGCSPFHLYHDIMDSTESLPAFG